MSQSSTSGQARTSSGSDNRSPRDRRNDPHQQASAIEKSVTHLLVATKQLLETLTQWSRGTATETDVSDVYVRLGYEFNIACRAFTQVGIETDDLGPVPDTLRSILEETLSQEASQSSLDKFLPKIRDIIINLLHGLKRKQGKLRTKTRAEEGASSRRTGSLVSATTLVNEDGDNTRSSMPPPRREGSRELNDTRSLHHTLSSAGTASPQRQHSTGSNEPRRTGSSGKATHTYPPPSEPPTFLPPALPPYPQENIIPGPTAPPTIQEPPPPSPREPPAPRPPPKQDALAALQRTGELERRASRRFSSYQLRKELGTSSVGVPMIPPAQRSPIPNRGRDGRESMQAIRSRGSQYLQRTKSRPHSPEGKVEPVTSVRQTLRDGNIETNAPVFTPPTEQPAALQSPHAQTPDEKYGKPASYNQPSPGDMQATISRPWDAGYPIPELPEPAEQPESASESPVYKAVEPEKPRPVETKKDTAVRQSVVAEPLVLFLQYNTKVKKFVLPGGFEDLTMEKLQYGFIEKFSWNVHNNDVELPEIYIHDSASGIRHELDDLNDVKNHSVLALNTDHVSEVKKQVESSMADIRGLIEGVTKAIGDQSQSIQSISKRQQDSAEEVTRLAARPAQPFSQPAIPNGVPKAPRINQSQLEEIQAVRRELAVMRQKHSSDVASKDIELGKIREAAMKEASKRNALPPGEGDSDRAYVDEGKKRMNDQCGILIDKVDTVQNRVEILRKDVTRGSRPRPEDLELRRNDLNTALKELRSLREVANRETPLWKKIGEKQLKAVMEDQEDIKLNEEIFADLADDIDKTAATLDLVAEAAQQQTTRSTSRTLRHPTVATNEEAKRAQATVLGEVRALQPNHDSRLAAIQDAEDKRQQALALGLGIDNPFKKELGQFVGDSKLKKTGGVEEVERLRVQREEDARNANHENQLRLARERAEREAAESSEEEEDDEDYGVSDAPPRLEVPGFDDDGQVSPEPEFVEAPEPPLGHPNGVGL